MADPGILRMTVARIFGTASLKPLRKLLPEVVAIDRRPPLKQRLGDHFVFADSRNRAGLAAASTGDRRYEIRGVEIWHA
jgi:hypothetical protein